MTDCNQSILGFLKSETQIRNTKNDKSETEFTLNSFYDKLEQQASFILYELEEKSTFPNSS